MVIDKNSLPIAFFDSGVGGISVLRHAVKLLPNEDFLFFGDSANAPYGTRPKQEILELTLSHAARFHARGIKALVIACNTATSAAISELRRIYTDIPVIGIEPALKPAALMSPHPTVLVMATPGTVNGNKFHDLLGHYSGKADVIPLGCPGLMEFVKRVTPKAPKSLHTSPLSSHPAWRRRTWMPLFSAALTTPLSLPSSGKSPEAVCGSSTEAKEPPGN